MSHFANLGLKPASVTTEDAFDRWFTDLAGQLLNGIDVLVAGTPYRIAELEVYYHGPGHADPFAHRDPIQLENGRWYFHRHGRRYRGGSFKGLDLTFGDRIAYGGILLRSIVAPDGRAITGPCRTVEHLLTRIGAKDVATLDQQIAGRTVWDAAAPLAICVPAVPRSAPVYRSSRVGLSLKRAIPEAPRFVGKPYRFLTTPRVIAQGRLHLVLSLHQTGLPPAAIHELTGVPRHAIDRFLAHFEAGRAARSFDRYCGRRLTSAEVCALLGTWAATYSRSE
jgi:hypothetical protein